MVSKVLSGSHIVKVSTSLNSGAGRAFTLYCHALRELGAEVEAWVFKPGEAMLEELADDGFPTRVLDLRLQSHCWSSSRALASALADSAPDWVHAHSYSAGLHASRAKAAGAINQLIITHHDARLRWSRCIMAWPYRRAPDVVIAPSPSCAKRIASWYGYPPDRVATFPLPVNTACFDPPACKQELARELGLVDAFPVIIWVARMQKEKGHADLLHAFRTVAKHYPSARLVFVGDGKHGPHLQNLSRRLALSEQVLFTGLRSDIPALLSVADIFACPSHAEALCMAVQEAMASSRPVVSTACGGPSDHISDGENGLLVPIGQPKALAEAILRVAGNVALAERLGEAGRAYAQEHFSMEQFVAGLADVYMAATDHREC